MGAPQMRERTVENLLRNRPIYEPPRFMTVAQAATLLMKMEAAFGQGPCGPEALAIGVARVGRADQVWASLSARAHPFHRGGS